MFIRTQICIIGAGPAGAAAALQLDRLGIPSTIVDKAVFPRDKVCGDGLSGKAITGLERIDAAIVERFRQQSFVRESWSVSFIAPSRVDMNMAYAPLVRNNEKLAPSFVCKRVDFDNFLVEELKHSANVTLHEGVNISAYTLTPEGYELRDKARDITILADLVIVANGAHSQFSKEVAGFKMEPKHNAAGLRVYYDGIEDLKTDGAIELHFLYSVLPGYLWIFPLPNGEANVGVGMLTQAVTKKRINLKKLLQDTIQHDPVLQKRFKNAVVKSTIDGYGLPFGSKIRSLSGDRYMLIGDAGFLIDPFSGEGIGNGIYSGRLAAMQAKEAISRNDYSRNCLVEYDQRLYKSLGTELKLSHRLQQLVKYPRLLNWLMKLGANNKQVNELITCMFYDIDIRKKLAKPSFYFKLLFNKP
ncbi:geranylgeranyl reductase family protein [Chitinophaga skermanii]|uniref:Geranylgeranyl reductase family protein n=1 Tax=Chitinophaga skermanii TaxID=331697 RepID=A0A327Q4K5_9BACT|nr:NAD(P)/FAD-dependent oxidoreductase [Chitinophaga skermanii]RAI98707.1 geranylgeranyl reductase family protein [Chitinophaga skermanii]